MRLPVYWDLVEKQPGIYEYADVDWQLDEAKKRDVAVILTVGIKVPRWPECHIPQWVGDDASVRTDSGELSLWVQAASRGDEFGTTLYRDIYSPKVGGYFEYPIGPNFFRFKEKMVRWFTSQEHFSVIELQAEPWASGWIADISLSEQFKTMNETRLVENVDYARQVGFHDIYLWGGEWWYWMKTQQGNEGYWNAIKTRVNTAK